MARMRFCLALLSLLLPLAPEAASPSRPVVPKIGADCTQVLAQVSRDQERIAELSLVRKAATTQKQLLLFHTNNFGITELRSVQVTDLKSTDRGWVLVVADNSKNKTELAFAHVQVIGFEQDSSPLPIYGDRSGSAENYSPDKVERLLRLRKALSEKRRVTVTWSRSGTTVSMTGFVQAIDIDPLKNIHVLFHDVNGRNLSRLFSLTDLASATIDERVAVNEPRELPLGLNFLLSEPRDRGFRLGLASYLIPPHVRSELKDLELMTQERFDVLDLLERALIENRPIRFFEGNRFRYGRVARIQADASLMPIATILDLAGSQRIYRSIKSLTQVELVDKAPKTKTAQEFVAVETPHFRVSSSALKLLDETETKYVQYLAQALKNGNTLEWYQGGMHFKRAHLRQIFSDPAEEIIFVFHDGLEEYVATFDGLVSRDPLTDFAMNFLNDHRPIRPKIVTSPWLAKHLDGRIRISEHRYRNLLRFESNNELHEVDTLATALYNNLPIEFDWSDSGSTQRVRARVLQIESSGTFHNDILAVIKIDGQKGARIISTLAMPNLKIGQ